MPSQREVYSPILLDRCRGTASAVAASDLSAARHVSGSPVTCCRMDLCHLYSPEHFTGFVLDLLDGDLSPELASRSLGAGDARLLCISDGRLSGDWGSCEPHWGRARAIPALSVGCHEGKKLRSVQVSGRSEA